MDGNNNSGKLEKPPRRRGPGRPLGSAAKKTREVADLAAERGITPLEVMLEIMQTFKAAGDLTKAAAVAKDAAPYVHARLSAVEVSGMTTQALPAISMDAASLAEVVRTLNKEF